MRNHVRLAGVFAKLLDSQFKIGNFRFGIDPLLGIIPGIGDVIPLVLSFYIVWIAKELKVPAHEISKMYQNIVFDLVLGIIPIVGDMSDFVYKANSKNMDIIKKYASNVVEGEML